ncbi:MAG: pyrroline-5-carboxylate reductase family protein, partial [Pirellulaceae bacterium]
DVAMQLAVQTVLGTAKMAQASGPHPAVLRDQVTSPGGTTIAALQVLENRGVRSAFIDAVMAATQRSRNLGG